MLFCRSTLIAMAALACAAQEMACAQTPLPPPESSAELISLRGDIRAGRLPDVHSLLILQHGSPVVEWYFELSDEPRRPPVEMVGLGPDTLHEVRSVTKSVVSILFGIALAEGSIASVDEPFLAYFPDYADLHTPERSRIRLHHLLSMTSGIQWDDRTASIYDPRNDESAMRAAPDHIRYILSKPLAAAPGERFNYSGADVVLIGEIIARATRMPLDEFAKSRLFEPLGMTEFRWARDITGALVTASGLVLQPRAMGKIGQLMLQNGRWGGRQLVPAAWVAASTSPHSQPQPHGPCAPSYGYYWWVGVFCEQSARIPYFGAVGNGGQHIWIVPSLDAVVVTTAGRYGKSDQPVAEAARRALRSTLLDSGLGHDENIARALADHSSRHTAKQR